MLGVSIPLGSAQRATSAIASANAEQQSAEHQQQAASIQMQTQLISLVAAYEQTLAEIQSLQTDVLPPLKKAMQATADAFAQGRYSYLELNLAQHELLDAKLALIEAATYAHNTKIDLERITDTALTSTTELMP